MENHVFFMTPILTYYATGYTGMILFVFWIINYFIQRPGYELIHCLGCHREINVFLPGDLIGRMYEKRLEIIKRTVFFSLGKDRDPGFPDPGFFKGLPVQSGRFPLNLCSLGFKRQQPMLLSPAGYWFCGVIMILLPQIR